MNGFRNSSRNGQVWRYQSAGGLPVLHPGQTGSSLPEKGLNTATGAAGEGCNEKSSLHYSRSQKAERRL